MTTQTDTPEELAAEIERLRAKNAELLQELKASKAKASADSTEVEALRAEVLDYKLNRPVESLLSSVLVGKKYANAELMESYTFELNDDGQIEMRDSDGKAVEIAYKAEDGTNAKRPIKLEAGEVHKYLEEQGKFAHILRGSGASGGGAQGSQGGYSKPSQPTQESQPKAAFGLK